MAASRPVLGERRMSDVEALMWNLEKDPYLALFVRERHVARPASGSGSIARRDSPTR